MTAKSSDDRKRLSHLILLIVGIGLCGSGLFLVVGKTLSTATPPPAPDSVKTTASETTASVDFPITRTLSLSDCSRPTHQGAAWDRGRRFFIDGKGSTIDCGERKTADRIELSLANTDTYRLEFYDADGLLGSSPIPVYGWKDNRTALWVHEVNPPEKAQDGFTRLVLKTENKKTGSLAHIRFLTAAPKILTPTLPLADVLTIRGHRTQWDAPGNYFFDQSGITVTMPKLHFWELLEITLANFVNYQIDFLRNDSLIASKRIPIRAYDDNRKTLILHHIQTPREVHYDGYDALVFRVESDDTASIGHIEVKYEYSSFRERKYFKNAWFEGKTPVKIDPDKPIESF